MQRVQVTSADLRSIGYDAAERVLEVEFVSGAVYEYYDVPHQVWEGLRTAQSHGRYFNEHIRRRPYRYRRLS